MKNSAKLLAMMAFAGIGVSSLASEVFADRLIKCRMKGTWSKTGTAGDDFEFDASYIAKDGPDTFTGRYVNPGQSEGEFVGAATNGKWLILLKYTDAGHKGMTKEMIGTGYKDPKKNLIVISGNYRTLVGGSDIKASGLFKLAGTCRSG